MMIRYSISLCDDVFFFKQKTAYEVRISDWSSDVCSSDLQQRRTAKHLGGNSFVFGLVRAFVDRRGEGSIRQLDHNRRTEGRYQIGRASCRERVCQYV